MTCSICMYIYLSCLIIFKKIINLISLFYQDANICTEEELQRNLESWNQELGSDLPKTDDHIPHVIFYLILFLFYLI